MFPRKIRKHLIDTFDKRYATFSKSQMISYLSEYEDDEETIKLVINSYYNDLTKIVYNLLDKTPVVEIIHDIDVNNIKQKIRRDPSKNYHDYFTEFEIDTNHVMYDLIVTVNYRYVYS